MGQELTTSRYADRKLMKTIDPRRDWCDRYEFAMAATCGAAAGLVDAVFIKNPQASTKLSQLTDEKVGEIVISFSKLLGAHPKDLESAIRFLESKAKVNYDQRNSTDVGGKHALSPLDHHIKSLAHAPTLIGLVFSIIDQLLDVSTTVSGGKLYLTPTGCGDHHLYGKTFEEKLVAAFINWMCHCMSDVAGSSGSARNKKRGSGLPMPGTEMMMFCGIPIGKDGKTVEEIMTRAFRQGYDFRFGIAQATAVSFQKAATAVCWVLKRHLLDKKPWKECMPDDREGSLRMMQLTGNATLCMVDVGNAALKSGGEPEAFVLNFNFTAALQMAYLVLHEVDLRMDTAMEQKMNELYASLMEISTLKEQRNIRKMDERIHRYQMELKQEYVLFCVQVESDEWQFMKTLKATDAWYLSRAKRVEASAIHAQANGVDKKKILHTVADIDAKSGVQRKSGFGLFSMKK